MNRHHQPFAVQLLNLTLIQLANWRWSWRGMLITAVVAPVLTTLGLSAFVAHSDTETLAYILSGNLVMSLLFGTLNNVAGHFSYMRIVGRMDFFATLPIYRVTLIIATVFAFLVLALPSTIVESHPRRSDPAPRSAHQPADPAGDSPDRNGPQRGRGDYRAGDAHAGRGRGGQHAAHFPAGRLRPGARPAGSPAGTCRADQSDFPGDLCRVCPAPDAARHAGSDSAGHRSDRVGGGAGRIVVDRRDEDGLAAELGSKSVRGSCALRTSVLK